MKDNGIVPDDWLVQNSMSLPSDRYSQIAYESQVFFQLDENILKITEKCGPGFEGGYDAFGIALGCLEKMSNSYHTVSLNMNMYLPDLYPSAWIGDEFYKIEKKFSRFHNVDFLSANFRFSLTEDLEEEYLHMEFTTGKINHKEQGFKPAVVMNCGVILKSPRLSKQRERIETWNEAHSLILSQLIELTSES